MEADFVAASRQVTFDDALDGLPVFLPYPLLEAREVYVLLQGVDEAERGLYLGGPAEEPLLIVGDESVEYFLEFRAITGGVKGKSRKGGDGLAEQARIEPGKTGCNLGLAAAAAFEQFGIPDKDVVPAFHLSQLAQGIVEHPLEGLRIGFLDGGRDDEALSRLHLHRQDARNQQVLHAVETAAVLVGVGDAVVPARVVAVGERTAELKIELRTGTVEPVGHSGRNLHIGSVGLVVTGGEGVHVPECKERLQLESQLGR